MLQLSNILQGLQSKLLCYNGMLQGPNGRKNCLGVHIAIATVVTRKKLQGQFTAISSGAPWAFGSATDDA